MPDVLVRRVRGATVIMIHRPQVRNALGLATIRRLDEALDGARKSAAVVFTGSGDRSFVSGRDIRDLGSLGWRDALDHSLAGLVGRIENFERPTIAAINGAALGGGLELALACDIRIAVPEAVFGLPETRLGIIPAAGGTMKLGRFVGIGLAKEMILTGRTVDARRACEVGLVSQVVSRDRLLDSALATARAIAERGPMATRLAKIVLNLSSEAPLAVERLSQALLYESDDKREGIRAFLGRRKPRFRGR